MKTAFLGVVVGLAALVAVVGTFAAFFAVDRAQRANASAEEVATVHEHIAAAPAAAAHSDLASFAGNTAPNADAIAMKHVARDATLPPIPAGDVVPVNLVLKDVTIEIAPGVKYAAWGFEGGAPGPAIHVRQGQTVKITLKNSGAIPHSVDFHAARIAPNLAFKDVAPGESLTYTFEAKDPGVFMYHCGTKPVLAHIANGMFGAIVVEPATPLPPADKEYVLVSSEWYLNSDGIDKPASFSMDKAHAMMPDWTTWNGYAGQYVTHPLTSKPGETVRFWVMDAGPSLDTDFHVVGTILDRAWVNGDMSQFQRGVQTVSVPAGGGAVFDVKIDEPGLYPFVSHSFASVDLGLVGLLKVGNVAGTMSH